VGFWDQRIGVGDSVTKSFRLTKSYLSGEASYVRTITKPVVGTVLVAVAGDPKIEVIEYSIDTASGTIEFVSPPDIGVVVTAGFEFDVPVRFDSDRIYTSVSSFQAGDIPNIPVVEVRLS
jgi:uncharacterized protein (TIGR02217 family)